MALRWVSYEELSFNHLLCQCSCTSYSCVYSVLYFDSEDPVKKKSQGSLESSSRSEDDEGSDSLGVYEEDPTKFNDEGSFIDQAGYKHVLEATSTPDGNAI